MYDSYENLPEEYADAVRAYPPAAAMLTMADAELMELREKIEHELEEKPEDETAEDFRLGRTAALRWLMSMTAALINSDLSPDDFLR